MAKARVEDKAIEVDNSSIIGRVNARERKSKLKRCFIILLIVQVVLLTVVLGIGLGLTQGFKSSNKILTGSALSVSSNSSSFIFFLYTLGATDSKSLANTTSAHYAALDWLNNSKANSQFKFENSSFANDTALQLIAKQRFAAATLHYSLQGSSWTNSSGWMSSSDVCAWNGVYCGTGALNATIQAFILDEQKLIGTLPPEIQLFDSLNYLSLVNNVLMGSLPSGLFKLTKLQYLDLASNFLSGQISTTIGQLSNLVYLNLGSNRFNGVIPTSLGLLTNLTQLGMDSNNFNSSISTIPSQIGQLTKLTSLRMQNMGGLSGGLGGKIPTQLGNCQKLGTAHRLISIQNDGYFLFHVMLTNNIS